MSEPYILPAKLYDPERHQRQATGSSNWKSSSFPPGVDANWLMVVRDAPRPKDLKDTILEAIDEWHGRGLQDEFATHLEIAILRRFELAGWVEQKETWADMP